MQEPVLRHADLINPGMVPASAVEVALYHHIDGTNGPWVRVYSRCGTPMQMTVDDWDLFLDDVARGCWPRVGVSDGEGV